MLPPFTNAERHLNALMKWHIKSADSGGALALGEVALQPGDEPPLHIHAREDEAWYVLEGTILFQRGLERTTCQPGDAILLPRGIAHGFAVQSPSARILHFYTPAGIERAFQQISVPLSEPAPAADPVAIGKAFGDRGVTFVGPPLPAILAQEQRK